MKCDSSTVVRLVLAALAWFQIDAKWLAYIQTAGAVARFLAYVGYVWSRDEDGK